MKNKKINNSLKLWKQAQNLIMDGTQLYSKGADVHVFGAYPIYLKKGRGSHVWDIDDNEYLDYSMGLGSVFLGYNYPRINQAIEEQLKNGINFSLVHPLEVEVARLLKKHIPCCQMLRFLKTGSTANAAAVRLARAYTNREIIIKGEYHGWHDSFMAISKRNAGIPQYLQKLTYYVEYNDLEKIESLFKKFADKIAAVITEPVISEPPKNNFLKRLRELTLKYGSLLIFDEVVTGFRFGLGGAQKYFGVTPDLATFGKAIANGMPLSIVCGRKEIFQKVKDKIFISTTFGGETLSLAAAKANILEMAEKNVFEKVQKWGEKFMEETGKIIKKYSLEDYLKLIGFPTRMNFQITYQNSKTWPELKALFCQEMVKRGILYGWTILPSFSHEDKDLKMTIAALDEVLPIIKKAIKNKNPEKYLEGKMPKAVEVL